MEMKTATLVRQMPVLDPTSNTTGIYHMSPPYEGNEYVCCSTADKPTYGVCETYIFSSNGEEITNWSELEGSQRDILSHKEVFQDIGYTTINPLC